MAEGGADVGDELMSHEAEEAEGDDGEHSCRGGGGGGGGGGGVKRCGADPCLARRVFPGMLAVMGGR